jgi:tetratricopeptide (TPR) repeat protein
VGASSIVDDAGLAVRSPTRIEPERSGGLNANRPLGARGAGRTRSGRVGIESRYHGRVRALIVALTLFAEPASGGIAVDWRGAETPDEALRLSVREAVAGVDGRPVAVVPDEALARARVAVSREQPATIRALRTELRAGLDQADAAHREGRFDDALALLEHTLESLHAHPEVPGAAASAREAHLLAARIAWARGESGAAEQALAEALRLDPEARLAARQAPPELIERYQALQTNLLAARERDWATPQLAGVDVDDPGVSVAIDGVPGLRPVPPGHHFVIVHRDGHEPTATWRELGSEWTVPAARERISTDPDVEHEAICRALALDLLVLAELRGESMGLQGYRCGVGYGPLWTGEREELPAAAQVILAGPFDATAASLAGSWLRPLVEPDPIVEPDDPKPWYRRGWIWGTSAGVAVAIAGSVVAGVLLGGREQPTSLEIDANDFIGH